MIHFRDLSRISIRQKFFPLARKGKLQSTARRRTRKSRYTFPPIWEKINVDFCNSQNWTTDTVNFETRCRLSRPSLLAFIQRPIHSRSLAILSFSRHSHSRHTRVKRKIAHAIGTAAHLPLSLRYIFYIFLSNVGIVHTQVGICTYIYMCASTYINTYIYTESRKRVCLCVCVCVLFYF